MCAFCITGNFSIHINKYPTCNSSKRLVSAKMRGVEEQKKMKRMCITLNVFGQRQRRRLVLNERLDFNHQNHDPDHAMNTPYPKTTQDTTCLHILLFPLYSFLLQYQVLRQ